VDPESISRGQLHLSQEVLSMGPNHQLLLQALDSVQADHFRLTQLSYLNKKGSRFGHVHVI
jgi:hypothetical protein